MYHVITLNVINMHQLTNYKSSLACRMIDNKEEQSIYDAPDPTILK